MTLTPIDIPTRQTRVQILWEGGAVTDFVVARPRAASPHPDKPMDDAIRCLVEQGERDIDIAEQLNVRGNRTAAGRPWSPMSVRRIRRRLGLDRAPVPAPRIGDDGLYSTRGVADRFGVTRSTITRWVRLGLLKTAKVGTRGHSAWYHLDEESVRRIEDDRRNNRGPNPAHAAVGGEAS